MLKVKSEQSLMEPSIRPLLEAANTETWKDSLNILYISGHVTSFSEELDIPLLVSARGPYHETTQSLDLLKGKATVAISPIIKKFAKSLLSNILGIMKQSDVTSIIQEDNEEMATALLITKFMPMIQSFQEELYKTFIQSATKLLDILAISVYNSLLEMREKIIRSSLEENEYEDMIDSLLGINFIESRLQVSICPVCANYEMKISQYPTFEYHCPKCGEEWSTLNLYGFNPSYEEIKKNNSDIPLFISSYLKHKIFYFTPGSEISIYPLSIIESEDGTIFEIDVYIPDFSVGIECKIFDDAFAPMTRSRINSIIGRLSSQIKNYFDFGLDNVIIITNLIESSKNKIETSLKKKLIEDNYPNNIEFIPKDIDKLIGWLNERANSITNYLRESFAKALEQKLELSSLPKKEDI